MKKPELLAPAGGIPQLIAAVENGADAVYLGGDLFNARMNASNFSIDEIRRAVVFAHKRDVDIHVTMNTLLKDEELLPALEYAGKLYEAGVDALIVQDMGLVRLLRKYLPGMTLHMSTQCTASDVRTVRAAGDMGFSRVVLARELSLDEIREMCRQDVEIEVFVHGALCICYSGQCQLSRYFGTRSGNRGTCAQPCRLGYRTFCDDGKMNTGAPGHPLSPRDMCLVDHMAELINAGVTSFKIEGRMKSPEYVAQVVSVYRKYIDQVLAGGDGMVSPRDRMDLSQIFNRGRFTDAYLRGDSGKDLMSGTIPKNQGILIGNVAGRGKGDLVDISLKKEMDVVAQNGSRSGGRRVTWPLTTGDGVEIRSSHDRENKGEDNGAVSGGIISYCRLAGDLVRIGDIKDKRNSIRIGDPVYRTSSVLQMRELEESFRGKTLEEGKFQRKTDVELFVTEKDGMLKLAAEHQRGNRAEAEAGPFENSREGGPDLRARGEKAFSKTGGTPYNIRKIHWLAGENYDISMSRLNALRREVLERLDETFIQDRPAMMDTGLREPELSGDESASRVLELYYLDWETFSRDGREHVTAAGNKYGIPVRCLVPLVELHRHRGEMVGDITVIPYISNVSRGRENEYIEEHLDSILELTGKTGVYIGSIGWLQVFRSAGVTVYGDYGLNTFNSSAVRALKELGMAGVALSLESAAKNCGAYPLMTLEHRPDGDLLEKRSHGRPVDSGERVRVFNRNFSDQTLIIPDLDELGFTELEELQVRGCDVARIYVPPLRQGIPDGGRRSNTEGRLPFSD